MTRFRGLLISLFASCSFVSTADSAETNTGHIVFKRLESTNLSEILKNRRLALEKRQGKPLTGHQWWLWGLSSFDYDLDGDLDLLVCIHGSTDGVVLKNEWKETGHITFVDVTGSLGVDGIVPSTDNYPLVWDFDGDGYLDIAGLLDDTRTPCLLNEQGKRFRKATFSLHPINYPDAIRDLNDDGYVDIQQTRRGKKVQFTYDSETGSFKKSESDANHPAGLPQAVQRELNDLRSKPGNRFIKFKFLRHDLDDDGFADLVVRGFGSYSGDRMGWYLVADKEGNYHDRTKEMGLSREGAPLVIEDLDHDGDIDVLTASAKSGGLYLNDGRGRFALRPGPLTEFVKQRCPYLHVAFRVDLDNDGDLDLAISNRRYGRQKVFENLRAGEFVPVLEVRGWDADPMVLRDINEDGLTDIIVGGSDGKESIGVFLNQTQQTGNYCQLHLRMKKPNVYAVGARVELYRPGSLVPTSTKNSKPILAENGHLDGSPIQLGLGAEKEFDLRVKFPGHKTMDLQNIAARPKLFVTPTGISTSQGDATK